MNSFGRLSGSAFVVSVKNLMYDKHNGDHGILSNYNLSHLARRPRLSGTECTSTMPFMALDLLTDEAWDGKIMQLYVTTVSHLHGGFVAVMKMAKRSLICPWVNSSQGATINASQ